MLHFILILLTAQGPIGGLERHIGGDFTSWQACEAEGTKLVQQTQRDASGPYFASFNEPRAWKYECQALSSNDAKRSGSP